MVDCVNLFVFLIDHPCKITTLLSALVSYEPCVCLTYSLFTPRFSCSNCSLGNLSKTLYSEWISQFKPSAAVIALLQRIIWPEDTVVPFLHEISLDFVDEDYPCI